MTKYILCRLDLFLNPLVTMTLGSVATPNTPCMLLQAPGAFITVFESEVPKQKIVDKLNKIPHIHYMLSEYNTTSSNLFEAPQPINQIEELQAKLQAAVEAEDYVEAARLKAKISNLK